MTRVREPSLSELVGEQIGRSVEEWAGKTPDAAIPPRVRARVFARYGGICQLSKRKIGAAEAWDLDHRIPLALGGEHRESNLWPVLKDAHKTKTRSDVDQIAKARRQNLKHRGLWPKSKRPLKSRGFEKTRPTANTRDGA